MTCVETSAAFSPSFAQTRSSTSGERCANAPTAPLILPTATVSLRLLKPLAVPLHFRIPQRPDKPERCRLGVNAVRPADLRRVLKFERPTFQDRKQRIDLASKMTRTLPLAATRWPYRPHRSTSGRNERIAPPGRCSRPDSS